MRRADRRGANNDAPSLQSANNKRRSPPFDPDFQTRDLDSIGFTSHLPHRFFSLSAVVLTSLGGTVNRVPERRRSMPEKTRQELVRFRGYGNLLRWRSLWDLNFENAIF